MYRSPKWRRRLLLSTVVSGMRNSGGVRQHRNVAAVAGEVRAVEDIAPLEVDSKVERCPSGLRSTLGSDFGEHHQATPTHLVAHSIPTAYGVNVFLDVNP
jgi:hypothetical protein